jgi:hypothetical protein
MQPAMSDVFATAPVRENRQSAQFDEILRQARDAMCERLDDAIASMLDHAAENLLALINDTRDLAERRNYEEAREVAVKRRATIEAYFQEQYVEEFQRRCNRARKFGESFDQADVSLETLELVEQEDFDETLKFNEMANKLRVYCDDELVALDQRVGVLLGDANLKSNDNPFSPQVICDTYKHACRELDVELSVRRVFLKLFDDHVLDDIRSVYKAINALLVRNSILPKVRFNYARDKNRGAPAPTEETPGDAPTADLPPVAPQDLFSILQKLLGSSAAAVGQAGTAGGSGVVVIPAGVGVAGTSSEAGVAGVGVAGTPAGVGVVGVPANMGAAEIPAGAGAVGVPAGMGAAVTVLQGAELMGSLTRIQRGDLSALAGTNLVACAVDPGTTNILRELKGTGVGAGMNQLDALTLDIVAMLFDQLFDDPKVPNTIKGLIGRLQIPILKVAIADKSFFSTKTHPVRRLLDAVGDIALRLPADFDASSPLFSRLQRILQELVDGFQDDIEVFTAAREQLYALLAEEDQRVEEQTRAEAQRAEESENLELARSVAQEEIRTRVLAHKVPLAVVEFLAKQWLKLLLLIHAKEGAESAAWKSALDVIDQLIWSVQPKSTPEECRKLGAMVPKLLKDLTTGLKSAGIEDAVREQFFVELMKHHRHALSTSEQEAPKPTDRESASRLHATARTNERPAANLDFSAPVTVKNPYGHGDVCVDSQDLDFTATANSARAKREESIRRALDSLGMGTWVEFSDADNPHKRRPARLIFVSPRKTRYLFAVDRAGKEIIQCTRAEIGRRLRIGEVVRLDKPPEESLFDRIMSSLLSKLRVPGRAGLFSG